jgi:hypothetical protein
MGGRVLDRPFFVKLGFRVQGSEVRNLNQCPAIACPGPWPLTPEPRPMKSLLAKIALRKVVGLYLSDREIVVSEVAATPLGPIEVSSRSEPCSSGDLVLSIERVLQSLRGNGKQQLHVAIGLPNSRMFFGTRPLRSGADSSADAVMQRLLCSSNVSLADLTIDIIKGNLEKTTLATVAACRKKYMAAILGACERSSALVIRTEPAPCALVRAASQSHRPPRRSKTILWTFLGAEEGISVLTIAGRPLAWRAFAMQKFSEKMAILSAVRTLLSQSHYHGIEAPLDHAIVTGRPDLHEQLQKDGLPTEIGSRMIWHAEPGLCGPTTAFGLALGCLNQTESAFDLSRWMKPRASLRDIFPWGELACEVMLMGLMGLALFHQNERVHSQLASAQMQCSGNKVLGSSSPADLEKEKKALTQKIEAAHQFLDTRVLWTNYARDISNCLPSNVQLTQWDAVNILATNGKGGGAGKSKKSLELVASAPLTAKGAIPPEVSKFLASLRANKSLKRDLPQIELTGIRQALARGGKEAEAGFTIVCQPAGAGGK